MHSIAIVGAGPAGCFCAQALVKLMPTVRIDLIDRLPVPYGLIRYGVAPDHQGTKAVIRQFERLFERNDVAFFGNAAVGDGVTQDDLAAAYDAVVFAGGIATDRRLDIPGEGLAGVWPSGLVTRAWNDYPDAPTVVPGEEVVVIGAGNVALDLVRLMAKGPEALEGSDLTCDLGTVRRIDVVARGSADAARFDPVMLRELGRLAHARITVHDAAGGGAVVEALAAIDGHAPAEARCEIAFHFGWTPQRIEGDDRVQAAVFARAGEVLRLPCDTVMTAIGFAGDSPGTDDAGVIRPGLYATGWCRRGATGAIPANRVDAQQVAARIAADLAGTAPKPNARALLRSLAPQAVDYQGWLRIDAAERAAAPPGRVRAKIRTRAAMLTLARTTGDT